MRISRVIASIIATAMVVTVVVSPAFAATDDSSYGGGSVQGYAADNTLDSGTVVQLSDKKANRVKIATQADMQNMFGVTVDRNSLPLTISNGELENEVFVAVSGTYKVLVSTQGGEIKSGDYLTMSSLNGVAMKAGTDESTVLGRANAPFNGKGVTLGSATLKDSTGKTNKTVSIGTIPVTISIQRNPNTKSTKVNVPDFLERIGQSIAEKEVSPIRIYLSMGITVICLIAAIVVLYAGIRNGVISIGRNPMSKKSIFRAILEVVLTSILILVIGLFAVYLLLKL